MLKIDAEAIAITSEQRSANTTNQMQTIFVATILYFLGVSLKRRNHQNLDYYRTYTRTTTINGVLNLIRSYWK